MIKKLGIGILIASFLFLGAHTTKAITLDDLANVINDLKTQINELKSQMNASVINSTRTSTTTENTIVKTETSTDARAEVAAPVITKTLTIGATGAEVVSLQNYLRAKDYLPTTVAPTGFYGRATSEAIKKLQAANGLSKTGSVGPMTRDVLKKMGNEYVPTKKTYSGYLPDDKKNIPLFAKPKFITETKVFLIGGTAESGDQNYNGTLYNDVYSSSNGINWEIISPQSVTTQTKFSPSFSFGYNTIFFKNKIWKIGGMNSTGNAINKDVWSSEDGVNWTQVGIISNNCIGSSIPVVFNGKIIVLFDECYTTGSNSPFNALFSSPDGVSWDNIDTNPNILGVQNPIWGQKFHPSFTVFNNKLWVMGGASYVGNMKVTHNDIWSSTDGVSWVNIDTNVIQPGIQNAPWIARQDHTALVFKNKLFVLGGVYKDVNSYNETVDDIWSSIDGVSWELVLADAPWARHQVGISQYIKGIRFAHSSFVLDDKIFIIGGEKPSQTCNVACSTSVSNDIWSSLDGIVWTQIIPTGDIPPVRARHATVVTSFNQMIQ